MQKEINPYLKAGGICSFLAAFLHVLIILGGTDWYRSFGAGEGMAQIAENGSTYPALMTAVIAITLAIWGLFAFSGAGIIRRLPLLKPVLSIISGIYILRGISGIPLVIFLEHPYLNELAEKMTFMIVSSMISLSIGLLYFKGLIQIWHGKMNEVS